MFRVDERDTCACAKLPPVEFLSRPLHTTSIQFRGAVVWLLTSLHIMLVQGAPPRIRRDLADRFFFPFAFNFSRPTVDIPSWTGPFYNAEGLCKPPPASMRGRFAFVFHYDSTPPNDKVRMFNEARASIVATKSIADVVLIIPKGANLSPKRVPGIKILLMDFPFEEKDVPHDNLMALKSRPNCCGWKEAYKFNIFRLPYDRVVYLDSDIRLARNVDHLFGCDADFLYTSGTHAPVNGGFWVVRPSPSLYTDVVTSYLSTSAWNTSTGWFGLGFICRIYHNGRVYHSMLPAESSSLCPRTNGLRVLYGYEGPQGFMFAKFSGLVPTQSKHWKAHPLDPCLYNNIWRHGCTVRTYGRSYVLHKPDTLNECSCLIPTPGCHAVKSIMWQTSRDSKKTVYERKPEPVPCRPSVFLVGSNKFHTTSLLDWLISLGGVETASYVKTRKEGFISDSMLEMTPFLSRQVVYRVSDRNSVVKALESVNSLFPDTGAALNSSDASRDPSKPLVIDSSAAYFADPRMPRRLVELCTHTSAHVKVVVVLSDPVTELEANIQAHFQGGSFWKAHREQLIHVQDLVQRTSAAIAKAPLGWEQGGYVLQIPARTPGSSSSSTLGFPSAAKMQSNAEDARSRFLVNGMHMYHLNRWLRYFTQEQLLVVCNEDIVRQPNVTLTRIAEFLGLERRLKEHASLPPYTPVTAEDTLSAGTSFKFDRNSALFKTIEGILAQQTKQGSFLGASCPWFTQP